MSHAAPNGAGNSLELASYKHHAPTEPLSLGPRELRFAHALPHRMQVYGSTLKLSRPAYAKEAALADFD